MKKATDNRNFIAIISYDEDPATELAPGEYLEQEFGWLQQSGFKLSDWALVDHDVLWEQYLRYLVKWAIEHSAEICTGPLSFCEWRSAPVPDSPKAEPSCEEVPLLIGYEENSRELAIENGPVDAMCYLPTPKAAASYFKKRLEAAAASGYVFCDEDADWASYTDEEREAVIRAGIRNQELHVTVCNGRPSNYKESYTIVIEKLKIYKEN